MNVAGITKPTSLFLLPKSFTLMELLLSSRIKLYKELDISIGTYPHGVQLHDQEMDR